MEAGEKIKVQMRFEGTERDILEAGVKTKSPFKMSRLFKKDINKEPMFDNFWGSS